RLSQVHGALERFDGWADISTEGTGPGDTENIVVLRPSNRGHDQAFPAELRRTGRGMRFLGACAASVAVIAVVATVLMLPQWRDRSIATDRGERREVVLDDGSVVQLDPQTQLKVRYANDLRQIQLASGRAVFRVAKDPTRPFLVSSGDTQV